jgi:glycosyltransferase involved in cell wall biosynthesis
MKCLIFTTDIPPVPGVPTSGTALRTFGLAQGLKALGHEIIVSVPKTALDGFRKVVATKPELKETLRSFELNAFDGRNQTSLIENSGADLVLCGHWPAFASAVKPSIPVVIDLAGPHLLERHYQKSENQDGAIISKLNVLNRADYFIVSGAKQRLYFLSYLLRAKVPAAEKRICTIPMPLPPETPLSGVARPMMNGASFEPRFVFGGVFLPWQNPSFGLKTVAAELTTRGKGHLTCIGGQHPNYPINEGIYRALFDELSRNPRVKTLPMAPYEDFISLLGEQDVAIDLMEWNLERELAVTIRSTTYLWAGVPVIYNSYADLGALISRYDAGWLVPPGDEAALCSVMDEIFSSPEVLQRKSVAAQTLAREQFAWDRAIQPLLSLLGTKPTETTHEIDIILDFPQNAECRLLEGKPLVQHFTCRIDGLNKVEFRIATHSISEPASFTAELIRADSRMSTKPSVVSRTFSTADIHNNDWHSLEFPPEAESAGAAYQLRLVSDSAKPEKAVSPWVCNGSPYPLTGLLYANQPVKGSALCVRTTCQSS